MGNGVGVRARAECYLALAFAPAALLCGSCGGNPPANVATTPVAASAASVLGAPSASEAADAYAYPADGPIPKLRSGRSTPLVVDQVVAAQTVTRHAADLETLLIAVPLTPEQAEHVDSFSAHDIVVTVARASGDPAPYAFVQSAGTGGEPPTELRVLMRRPASRAGAPIEGTIYTPMQKTLSGALAGMQLRFRADDSKRARVDATLEGTYLRALSSHFFGTNVADRGAFRAYAGTKLASMAPKPPRPAASELANPPSPPSQEAATLRLLESTMDASADSRRALATLMTEPALSAKIAREPTTIAASSLKPPTMPTTPWATILARTKATPKPEALADRTPADFWFLRARSVGALVRALENTDAWITPLFQVLRERTDDHALFDRYETELGVDRRALASALGPMAIDELAIVGSDPYLVEGTDLTVVMRVKNRALVDAGLAAALAARAQGHGAVTTDTRAHDGVTITVSKTADDAVRRQRATLGDLEVVSNSQAAIDRVIDVSHGKSPKLADEADFKTMLARDTRSSANPDASAADLLVHVGEKNIAALVSPRQRILESRRQLALGELALPGYAALLYGHLYGKPPASARDLERAKLLDASALTHARGGAIAWTPGQAARSSWGSAAALTPLIDLPWSGNVSKSERAAYERFAASAVSSLEYRVQPVMLRVAIDDAKLSVDVRSPLMADHDAKEMEELVGDTRIDPGRPQSGARAAMAISATSPLRRELDKAAALFARGKDMGFDWIGEWAAIGVLDRAALADSALQGFDDSLPQAPLEKKSRSGSFDDLRAVTHMPVYFELAIRSPAGAALAIAALRALAEEMAPGAFEWGESGKHRGVSIVKVGVGHDEASIFSVAKNASGYYAFAPGVLIVTTDELVMRKLIDERLSGGGTRGLAEGTRGAQIAFDIGGDKGGALDTVVGWLLETAMIESNAASRRAAAALLYGAPGVTDVRALGLAYFGAAPLTADGGRFTLAPDGVADPIRGTPHAPIWPDVPVPGSPVARALSALAHARFEAGLDDESGANVSDPTRTVHARLTIDRR